LQIAYFCDYLLTVLHAEHGVDVSVLFIICSGSDRTLCSM